MTFAFDNLQNLFPLILRGIAASGVVSTNMEYNNLLIVSLVKVLEHTLKIETLLSLVIVPIVLPFKSSFLTDTTVRRPGGIGH